MNERDLLASIFNSLTRCFDDADYRRLEARMTPKPSRESIQDEFERAFDSWLIRQARSPRELPNQQVTAEWAACWMAERLAKEAIESESGVIGAEQVRSIASELDK